MMVNLLLAAFACSLATSVTAGPLAAGDRLSPSLPKRAPQNNDDFDPCDLQGPQRYYIKTKLKDGDDPKKRNNFQDNYCSSFPSCPSQSIPSPSRERDQIEEESAQLTQPFTTVTIVPSIKDSSKFDISVASPSEREKAVQFVVGGQGLRIVPEVDCRNCQPKPLNHKRSPSPSPDPDPQGGDASMTISISGLPNLDAAGTRYVVMGNVTDPKLQQPMVVTDKDVSAGQFGRDNGRLVASSAFPIEWDAWAVCDTKGTGHPVLQWIGVNPPEAGSDQSKVYIKPDDDCSIVFLELGD